MDTPRLSHEEISAIRKKHFLSVVGTYYRHPLHLVKAQGRRVFDDQGRAYLDAIGGIVSISAGHNHPRIKSRLQTLIENDEIQHTTALYYSSHCAELAAELMKEALPRTSRVFFTNSGSEANELAFLAARQATGENMVMHLRHSYHGGTSGTLAVCGHSTWKFRSQPVTHVTAAAEPYCYRCPFGKKPESCSLECAQDVERAVQTTTHGKIAAFIAEPVMGVGGFITPPDAYFQEVVKIVHSYGGKYISDEVQTGAGRCGGDYLLSRTLKIDADVVTMAKGLGNGAPIGAVLMTEEMSQSLSGKTYFNTFGGDPFPSMQARTTIEIIREERLVENARVQGAFIRDHLNQMKKRFPLIGDVRSRGLMIGLELVKDALSKEPAVEETLELMEQTRERGLLIGKGGLLGNVIRLAPPLSITRQESEELLKILEESFAALKR